MSSDELNNCVVELKKVNAVLQSKPKSEHFLKQKKMLEGRIEKLGGKKASKLKAEPEPAREDPPQQEEDSREESNTGHTEAEKPE